MIFFNNANTYCKKFNIQLSLDGENFETAYESTDDFTEKVNELTVDKSNLTITQFKYVRINLLDGKKDYGYQIKEFAAIGEGENKTPNTANSSSELEEGLPVDESEFLATDYNLTYGAEYTQTSVGSQNFKVLTDGNVSGTEFVNTERNDDAKDQTFVIDIGREMSQKVSNIDTCSYITLMILQM